MQSDNRLKLLAGLFAAFLLAGNALAQEDDAAQRESEAQDTKQAQAVSKEVYDQITKAQELVEAKDYRGALNILNKLYDPDKLTEYEQANVLNYIGFVYYNMDDPANAIKTYDRMLAIPSLEAQMRKQVTFTLAQLNMMEENYERSLDLLNKWFALEPNPGPEPYILKAQALYQLERFKEMVEPIETGIRIARERELAIKEDWYVLLNFAYFQQEDYAKVRDIQKILLANWPKKRYWMSLAGAYTELGEDQNLVSAFDAAYTDGLLESESEFVTMAQLFMQREVPYKAAKLLEEKMKEGTVEANEKNYRLLSQAWTLAQEDDKAIPALQEAAKRAPDGELDVRLANSYLNIGEYGECVEAARNGLKKGDLKDPDNAQISLGMCLYNLRRYGPAKEAFQAAARVEKSRKTANQWIQVIDADVERNRQIEFAQESARKKQAEVEARRQRSGRLVSGL
jgi:tetratricopeptide (TPR) repeat protein